MSTYLKLALLGLVPAAVSALIAATRKAGRFSGLPYWARQVICGLIFAAISILNTECGVPKDGMILNVRDSAPLCAGLLFGAPAGLLAGFVGGAERYLRILWIAAGTTDVTRMACTLGTMLSGIIGAVFRKMIFEDKTPSWNYGLVIGLMTEIIHMLMVFLTNISDPRLAVRLLNTCALPMVTFNAFSVMLAVFVVHRIRFYGENAETIPLTRAITGRILLLVISVSCLTCYMSFRVQAKTAVHTGGNLMKLNIEDYEREAQDNTDYVICEMALSLSRQIPRPETVTPEQLNDLKPNANWNIAAIHVMDDDGNIRVSSDPSRIGDTPLTAEGFTLKKPVNEPDCIMLIPSEDTDNLQYIGAVNTDTGCRLLIGITREELHKILLDEFMDIARNRHVGEAGYLLVLDENNAVKNERDDRQKLSDFFAGIDLRSDYTEKKCYRSVINGTDSLWMYKKTKAQHLVVAVMPYGEAGFTAMFSTYILIFIQIFLFLILFIAVYILIRRQVVNNINRINAGLATITRGNLNESVNVRSHEEFITLSDGINATVDSLKGYINEASARIERELEIARTIQLSSLPRTFPAFPGRHDFDIYALMEPAREVGGDFYDFYMVDGNHLAFLVADVSGKGITAAMFMMRAKAIIKSYVTQRCGPAEALTRANEALYAGNDAEMFVTCWMGIMDLDTRLVTFANAGHNPPLVRRNGGTYEYFKSRPGMVLGGLEGIQYKDGTLQLCPGDEILLYTDGVTEATDARYRLYGEPRLQLVANSLLGKSCRDLCLGIKENLDRFAGTAPQADDITMVSIRLTPDDVLRGTPNRESCGRVADFLDKQLKDAGVDPKTLARIQVAADEIWNNIVSYSRAEQAELRCEIDEEAARLTFVDNGIPYNPLAKEDPDITLDAEERPIGGLGIYMVKQTMDEVDYQRRRGQNVLTMVKHRER